MTKAVTSHSQEILTLNSLTITDMPESHYLNVCLRTDSSDVIREVWLTLGPDSYASDYYRPTEFRIPSKPSPTLPFSCMTEYAYEYFMNNFDKEQFVAMKTWLLKMINGYAEEHGLSHG